MYTYDVDTQLEAGRYPILKMEAYDVTYNGPGYVRWMTRNSEKDITPEFIDISSIKVEVAMSSDNSFTPGGCIPATVSFRILRGSGLTLNPVELPKNAGDYSVLYRPRIYYQDVNGNLYLGACVLPYMILREKILSRGHSQSYNLTFEDELCMLDYMEYDVATKYGYPWGSVISFILETVGLAGTNEQGASDSGIVSNITTNSTCYYQGEPMSGRQALSYILQMHGAFAKMNENGKLHILELNDSGNTTDASMHQNYVSDVYFTNPDCGNGGIWDSIKIYGYDEETPTGNFPKKYILKGNPFVTSGNKSTYASPLSIRLQSHDPRENRGPEIECRYNVNFELGDLVKFNYNLIPSTITNTIVLITRIRWDGGAYCQIYGPIHEEYNRL